MNNQNKEFAVELDIKDIFWKLLTQWKAILLVSLIMALIVCGVIHKKSIEKYDAAVKSQKEAAEQANLSVDDRITAVIEGLPESERALVEYIAQEERLSKELKEYLHDSPIMNVDLTNVKVLKMTASLRSEDNPMTLVQKYCSIIKSPEMIEAIKPYLAPEADDRYIAEMILASNNFTNANEGEYRATINVNIDLTEEANGDVIAKIVKKVLSDHSSELQAQLNHNIDYTDVTVSREFDTELVNKRNGLYLNVNNFTIQLNNLKSTLTDSQKAALTGIEKINVEAEKGIPEQQKIHKPKYSKKYALVGFILGVIMYAFAYVTLLIIRNRVNNAADAERYTGARLLGEMYGEHRAKGMNVLFHSSYIEKLRNKNKLDTDTQIEKIASAVKAKCSHMGVKELALLDFTFKESAGGLIDGLKTALAEDDIRIDTVDVINTDENILSKTENALFALSEDARVPDLRRMLDLCKSYDVDGIGSIWFGEV